MPTNYSEPVNLTSVPDIFQYANSVSDDLFGPLILISLFLVVFMVTRLNGDIASNATVVASFITSFTATVMFFFDIITGYHLFTAIFIFAVSLFWKANE